MFMMKVGTYSKSNMLNLMVMFNRPALDGDIPFCENWVQKVKI